MSKPPILSGCDVLPPMHSTTLPNEVTDLHKDREEKTTKRKSAGRFAELNNFVDFSLAGLTPSAGVVWLVLYRDTKPNGIARTSQADLARRTGLSDRTIRRAIEQLKANELLQIVHQGGKWRGMSAYRVHPLPPTEYQTSVSYYNRTICTFSADMGVLCPIRDHKGPLYP